MLALVAASTLLSGSALAAEAAMPADIVPIDALVQAPSLTLTNGELSMKVYLPDAQDRFYRGSRFDWAGMIGSLRYRGHDFYMPWFRALSPGVRDFVFEGDAAHAGPNTAATGPVEEFNGEGGALGFAQAAPGGRFVKIGVGVLQRPDAAPFSAFQPYAIVDHGKRYTRSTRTSVAFTHSVSEPVSGYAYRYVKTLRLLKPEPVLVIEHELRNTGKQTIATQVYNHNFLNIDGRGTSAGLALTTPFTLVADTQPDPKLAAVAGNRIAYTGTMIPGQRVSTRLTGFGTTSADYDFHITDSASGAGLRITGDRPVERLVLWSIRPVMAIEPFIRMNIAPGQTFRWTYRYAFEAADSRAQN